jgi:hypothetical protein
MEKLPIMPDNPMCSWEYLYLTNPHVPGDYSKLSIAIVVAQCSELSLSGLVIILHQKQVLDIFFSDITFLISSIVLSTDNGRVFVGAGNYLEHVCLHEDSHVEATASAKGKVLLATKSSISDVPGINIKVEFY